MNQEQLLHEIQIQRDCGASHLVVFDRSEEKSWQEDLAEKTLHAGILSWNGVVFYRKNRKSAEQQAISIDEVDRSLKPVDSAEKAVRILTYLLNRDMAYGDELIPETKANEFAHHFIALFDHETARYFSNSGWDEHSPFGTGMSYWTDLTDATFNSGIIVIDKNTIGVAWFEDED